MKFNLASICERYGGGGHPKVGAISFPIGAIDQARKAAREIAAELAQTKRRAESPTCRCFKPSGTTTAGDV